jgi:hypothetical protein
MTILTAIRKYQAKPDDMFIESQTHAQIDLPAGPMA